MINVARYGSDNLFYFREITTKIFALPRQYVQNSNFWNHGKDFCWIISAIRGESNKLRRFVKFDHVVVGITDEKEDRSVILYDLCNFDSVLPELFLDRVYITDLQGDMCESRVLLCFIH